MGRFPISTQVVTAVLLVGVALVWGRVFDWCVWWQAAFAATALVAIVVLTIREGNRARIKDQKMLEALDGLKDEMKESTHTIIAESVEPLIKGQKRAERRTERRLDALQSLAERNLEAADPSYERPKVVNLKASVSLGVLTGRARLQVILPTRGQRMRRRLIYICKWVWGTHDAPSAKRRKS